MSKRPNIVYINSHDTGRILSPYGYAVRTPKLQRFAEQGVTFRHCHDGGPTCSPARAALCTGAWPHVCGQLGLTHRGFNVHTPSWHLAHYLQEHGYCTAYSGQPNHMVDPERVTAEQLGYQHHLTGDATEAAETFIADYDRDEPFFLSVSYGVTHRAGPGFATDPQPEDDPRWTLPPAPLADTATIRADWAHLCSDVNTMDSYFGRVIDAIDQAGYGENTIIIATTDHGPAFPGMKCHCNVHGTGVFLIMRGPGFEGGKVIDGMVSQVDIYPTLCEALGTEKPAWLCGTAMQPLVDGSAEQIHDEIYAEVTYHAAYQPMRAIRTPRHVYIKRFDERAAPVLPNCDRSPSKSSWVEVGWRDNPEEQLYDSFFDPQEMNNLASSPAHAQIKADLAARLDRWMRETNDPLLNGPVPLPEGGLTNDQNGLNPNNEPGPCPTTLSAV